MKKRLLLIMPALLLCVMLALTACGGTGNGGGTSEGGGSTSEKEEHKHTFGEWIDYSENANVYCENRLFYHICTECKIIEWRPGDFGDHSFTTMTVDPTCTAMGYDVKTCSECGYYEKFNYTDKIPHAWADEYNYDDGGHWIECEYGCATHTSYGEHVFVDDVCTVCGAESFTPGLQFTLNDDGNSYSVTDYSGTATEVVIYSSYKGLPVTSIGNFAFNARTSLTGVTIPDSVTSIGHGAFSSCYSLTSVTIPDSVTSIGNSAFSWCYSLTNITVSEGNTAYLSKDGNLYTKDGKTLVQYAIGKTETSFVIPSGVESIGDYAFYSCDSLTSVTIGNGVTSIGNYAFAYCDSLTSVTFENPVGWWRALRSDATSGTEISSSNLGNSSTAAWYLRSTYDDYYWKRG